MSDNIIKPTSPVDPDDAAYAAANAVLLQNAQKLNTPLEAAVVGPMPDVAPGENSPQGSNQAVSMIREKLERLYQDAPDTEQKIVESEIAQPRSNHQEFIYNLTNSGKNLAEIQTEWHNYYINLPDDEKYAVWQEFYELNSQTSELAATINQTDAEQKPSEADSPISATLEKARSLINATRPAQAKKALPKTNHRKTTLRKSSKPKKDDSDRRSTAEIKQQIVDKVSAGGKVKVKQHFQSLLFGLGTGALVLFIFLFSFFNEVVIAPFIQPSRTAGATPVIIDPSTFVSNGTPEVIIPKINVQIPVDYTLTTNDEAVIQQRLDSGIIHYPSTSKPGENGNAAFFGHSSHNLLHNGKYKFAFVRLHELQPGDTFYLTTKDKVYIYKVFSRKIVKPSEVSVLTDTGGKTATAALVTCDPPGTSINRLVVLGEQISPDVSTNTEPGAPPTTANIDQTAELPGNGESMWSRFWNWMF
jgi:LPXTG-site transpeptidase (sortase) family protein